MCELMPDSLGLKDFLNLGSKFVNKKCQLHLRIHWILTWYIVWPAGWLLYCGIWQDLLLRMTANANISHNFPHSRKLEYCIASEFLLCTISFITIGIKFIERSLMQAYFSSPNILHESRGLYYSYSGEVASLLNTPIFSKFIKNSTNFIKKTQVW